MSVGQHRTDDLDPPLRMDGVVYSQAALLPPFRAVPPAADEWRLYVVRGDGVALEAADLVGGRRPLRRGAVIGVSGAVRHAFASETQSGDASVETAWVETPLGAKTLVDAVVIAISRIPQSAKPFGSLLEPLIHIDPSESPEITARIGTMIDLTAEETARHDFGSSEMIVRMAEIITMQLRRAARARGMRLGAWPSDVAYDPRIWRAMSAISSEPQHPWTVESMAEVAGMSRSAFSARYRETVGQTPMRSLRRLRLHWAAASLCAFGPKRIASLAGALGYGSDEAFNRAFAREFGQPPQRYRLQGAAREAGEPDR